MKTNTSRNPSRILIVHPNWLGDTIISLPFIRAVRENFPHSFIASIAPESCKEVLEECPYLNKIIYFNERTSHRGIPKKIRFMSGLRREKFDTVFLIHRSFTRAVICYLAGIKERIGYYTKKRGWLLTKNIQPLPDKEVHRADYYLGILEGVGLKVNSRNYEFFINDSHRVSIEKKLKKAGLKEGERFAVLHPGANEAIRRWPVENFSSLASRITKELGLKVVISGSDKEILLGREAENPSSSKIINFCGKTSLKQLGALFEKSKFVVCGDTGPMHIASAVGAFVICLFGTASPKITGPRGKGEYVIIQKDVGCKIPCYDIFCSDNRCMKAIGVDDVMREAKKIPVG